MIADEQVTTEPSSLFSAQDQAAIRAQLKKRLILVLIPVLVLLGAAIYFAIQRNEVVTDVLTIVSLSVLIFCYDLFLKPLRCYQRHLDNGTPPRGGFAVSGDFGRHQPGGRRAVPRHDLHRPRREGPPV